MSLSVVTRPRSSTLKAPRITDAWSKPTFDKGPGALASGDLRGNAGLHAALIITRAMPRVQQHHVSWLKALTQAQTRKDVDAASYAVLSKIHDLLLERNTERCDAILRVAPVEQLPVQVLLALLAGTFRARAKLSERGAFYERVEGRIRRDEPARADALLRGLR